MLQRVISSAVAIVLLLPVGGSGQHATPTPRVPDGRPGASPPPSEEQRILLERYVRAWEHSDLDGFVALLKEDAILSMPPWREWYDGREAIRGFFSDAFATGGEGAFRLLPIVANGQPAFAQYTYGPEELECPKRVIQVLTLQRDAIAALTFFTDPEVFRAFGLPDEAPLPGA